VLVDAVRGEHDLDMLVVSGSKQHGAIQAVNGEVVARADEADTGMLQNLLHARVGSGDIDDAADVVIIADAFANMRDRLAAA
jgi:hypothetical protein